MAHQFGALWGYGNVALLLLWRFPQAKQVVSADVVKLVYTPDLGSGAERCESSSLSIRTIFYVCIFELNDTERHRDGSKY